MTTWSDLFDRAERHDVSWSAIREDLERRRAMDDGDEDEGDDDA